MAEFLTTNGISFQIENIIKNAKKELILVSPYLQLSKTFYERLKDASKRNINIKIIYGKDELKPSEKNSLAELKNLSLFFFDNLHAKCYFNESQMVISSMNIYEFSEKNNREMGVFIQKDVDPDLYRGGKKETISIIQSSELIGLSKTKRSVYKGKNTADKKDKPKSGYCIRCEDKIPYEINSPYCYDCFSVWNRWKDINFLETVCHACGMFNDTSMATPVCYSCFLKIEKSTTKNKIGY